MSYIKIEHVKKSFDKKEVLKDISLEIKKGDFVTFLGSSGCGKTTLLRSIVGLEKVDSGCIFLDGKEITHMDPEKRGVSMIFQQYCLFPTMTVFDNVSFGLRMSRIDRAEIRRRTDSILEMVEMSEHRDKFPYQLSGGEQQRVALARALVLNPKVLLLDEPFSAIDAKLRRELQISLKQIHRKFGMTSVFVTHDQEEAMRMSDVIHLFRDGKLEQSGSPNELYLHPKTTYVASFIGCYNLFSPDAVGESANGDVMYAVRSEAVEVSHSCSESSGERAVHFAGEVRDLIPQGGIVRLVVRTENGQTLQVDSMNGDGFDYRIGDPVHLTVQRQNIEVVKNI